MTTPVLPIRSRHYCAVPSNLRYLLSYRYPQAYSLSCRVVTSPRSDAPHSIGSRPLISCRRLRSLKQKPPNVELANWPKCGTH
jgi:hypothetical protein